VVKLHGEFLWHMHESEEEMFLVIQGRLVIKLRTGDIVLNEGEFFIIPRGWSTCRWPSRRCTSC
jgi:mannose-6-phosphate isomerase-like protein (cupin superfamily)